MWYCCIYSLLYGADSRNICLFATINSVALVSLSFNAIFLCLFDLLLPDNTLKTHTSTSFISGKWSDKQTCWPLCSSLCVAKPLLYSCMQEFLNSSLWLQYTVIIYKAGLNNFRKAWLTEVSLFGLFFQITRSWSERPGSAACSSIPTLVTSTPIPFSPLSCLSCQMSSPFHVCALFCPCLEGHTFAHSGHTLVLPL